MNSSLREYFAAALSLSDGGARKQWEQHLVEAFGAFLGGVDVFHTPCASRYLLVTEVRRDALVMHAYGGVMHEVPVSGPPTVRNLCVVGRGFILRLLPSDDVCRTQLPLGELTAVLTTVVAGKAVECFGQRGTCEDPLNCLLPVGSRLHSDSFLDIRGYGDHDALRNGIYGAWCSLVSDREEDWPSVEPIVTAVIGRF